MNSTHHYSVLYNTDTKQFSLTSGYKVLLTNEDGETTWLDSNTNIDDPYIKGVISIEKQAESVLQTAITLLNTLGDIKGEIQWV